MRIVVIGATGFIGSRLVPILLKAGHAVVAVGRDPEGVRFPPGVLPLGWDGQGMLQVPGKVDAVVNVAGESIAGKRWNDAQKQRLVDSRVQLTKRIAEFINRRRPSERPKAFVSASAMGYYGLAPEGEVTEESPPGTDFLAKLCQDWEAAAHQADCRTVTLRIAHVLGRDGGYLGALMPFARAGLAGPIAGGRQPMAWIHLDDLCGIILWAITNPAAQGAYNAVAPGLVAQRDFTKALNKFVPVPSIFPVPGFALKARFGELAQAMMGGQAARPERLVQEGYPFGHPELHEALQGILKPRARAPRSASRLAAAAADERPLDEEAPDSGE